MAQADWADLTNGLDSSSVARGPSNAYTRPSGGGNFVYGFRSLDAEDGVAGKYCNLTNFKPITGTKKGGSMQACIKRYSSATGYAPFFGLIVDKTPSAIGYFVGLTDASSYRIALKKGSPGSGLDESETAVLRKSNAGFTASGDSADAWFHLRLDVLVNPHGEVVLDVWENDLSTNPIGGSYSWEAIDGMSQFIDDSLGGLSGTEPELENFFAVFGHYTAAGQGNISLFDQIVVERQTGP